MNNTTPSHTIAWVRAALLMLVFVIVLSVLGTAYGALPVAVSDSLVTDPYASVTPSSQVYLPVISNTRQPNFVIIVSDDQRYDTIDYMPLTKARIFDQGITFSRAYVTTPICCPSRSSILTGMYAHHHRVYDNYAPLEQPTFVQRLREAGYFTGMVGKYLNSWDGAVRPEFDYWVVFAGHGAAQRYFDPTLNVNGNWIGHTGYMTHILQNYALDFLYRARQRQAPFMLIFAPNAPHEPGDPAPSDEDLYPGLPLYRPPSFMEEDLSDKPVYLQNRPPSNPDYLDALRRKQLQSLHALDITVDNVLTALSQSGQDANTVVMYISDNGVYWGEHRLDGKLYAYDEASHVPFAIRQPDLIPQPRVESRLVANIDIAPTVYELAGLSIPADVDGRSLTPLFKQTAGNWRTSLLIEGWGFLSYTAIQTERYLYIETPGDTSELYDSLDDPYQIDNRYTNPDYATVVSDLHTELTGYMAHVEPAPARIIPFMITALGLDD